MVQGSGQMGELSARRRRRRRRRRQNMTLDPARPEKTRRGVWGGVAPPVGLGFGMRPPPGSGSARITRNYPSRVQEGI